MRVLIRTLLSGLVSKKQRKSLKRLEHKVKKRIARFGPPLDRDEFKEILTRDLGLATGDTVMVHGGLSLINTPLSAADLRDLVLEIIGPEGTLVVPTFSPVAAIDYMQQEGIFDVRNSKSGMGAIAETVRMSPGAARSVHPTKSLAALGRDAEEICAGHESCIYPFGSGSPFEKLLARNARIIGIGVPMFYLSFVHVAEDMAPDQVPHQVWDPRILDKTCRDGVRDITVSTRVHNMETMARADPGKFCHNYVQNDQFTVVRRSGAPFFSIRAQYLYANILRGFKDGFSIYD